MTEVERFHLEDQNGVTTIAWAWRRPRHALFPLVMLIPIGYCWHWYSDAIADGVITRFEAGFVAFGVAMVLLLGYAALAKLCNRSRLTIDATAIALRQGPFPWPGDGRWPRAELERFVASVGGTNSVTWYTVYAVFAGGKRRRLAGDLREL